MTLDSETINLKKEIELAFADVPYPGDDDLVDGIDPESMDTAECFKGIKWQDWKEKPSQFLNPKFNSDLFFLSPAAFHYYLPLYMIFSLTDYEHANLFTGEIIMATRPASIELSEYVRKRLEVMTDRQLQIIIAFLKFIKQRHGNDWLPTYPLNEAIENVQSFINRKRSLGV
ncbi:MAG: hypothetical protein HY746_00360 [Elusimicrobia bacterium]|nr:hypothetical protein [Elusimicrobiota bacterium]